MPDTPHLIPVSAQFGLSAAVIDHNIRAHHHRTPTQSATVGQRESTGHPPFYPPPLFLVLIGGDVIPHIFSQIRGLKLRGRLTSFCLAMLCQSEGSLIPNIKVWLLA